MTMPIEQMTVECPECKHTYETNYRGSMNLRLDNFNPEYIDEMSTGTCPVCGHKVALGCLVVREDGAWEFQD